jgi:4'-phosphopantetheinyl transferase
MPQLPELHINQSLLLLWNITESIEDLNLLLGDRSIDISQLKNKNHQKQLLVKNMLLKQYNLTPFLQYQSSGKPYLTDGRYISISHSNHLAGVVVHKEPVGLDIETNNPKLLKIAPRFVSAGDTKMPFLDELTGLQFLWTAKESIYKLAGIQGLSFKDDIQITHIDLDQMKGQALLKNQQKIDLFFEQLSNNYLLCLAFFNP